jgi:hypothetical protein
MYTLDWQFSKIKELVLSFFFLIIKLLFLIPLLSFVVLEVFRVFQKKKKASFSRIYTRKKKLSNFLLFKKLGSQSGENSPKKIAGSADPCLTVLKSLNLEVL